jgi:hypothetical protein
MVCCGGGGGDGGGDDCMFRGYDGIAAIYYGTYKFFECAQDVKFGSL